MSDPSTAKLEKRNGSDPRLDRLAGYALNVVVTIALALGAWYARSTGEKVDALGAQLGDLRTEVAVLRTSGQDSAELRAIVRALQLQVTSLQGEVTTLRRDVDRPR